MRNSSLLICLIVALNACSPTYQQDFYEPDYSQFHNEGVPYRTIDEIESKFLYPEQLTDKQISGNVHSAFLVDKFGEVVNIEHIDSFSPYASMEVTRVLSSELFYPKRVNSIWKPTLLFSLATFDNNTSKVNITFSDTSFVQLSRQEQQQILSNLTGGNSYFIEPVLIGGLDSIEINYPDEAKKEKLKAQ